MHTKNESVRDFLKQLSSQEFLHVGIDQIAYVRPIGENDNGHYGVYAADGTQISVMDDYNKALASIHDHEMHAVTVH